MHFFGKFLLRLALNAAALGLASFFLTGFDLAPHAFSEILQIPPLAQSAIAGGLLLAALNTFARPVLRFLSFPLIILTLGFFNIVINLAILAAADWFLGSLTITGFLPLLIGSFLIGIANTFL